LEISLLATLKKCCLGKIALLLFHPFNCPEKRLLHPFSEAHPTLEKQAQEDSLLVPHTPRGFPFTLSHTYALNTIARFAQRENHSMCTQKKPGASMENHRDGVYTDVTQK
jgi:hypothetical protein